MSIDLTIKQGKTFQKLLFWETPPLVFKPISAMTNAAPARITATAHGVPDGWRVAVVGAKGMTELNAIDMPPGRADLHAATVVDVNTVTLNEVSATAFGRYTSGGFLCYYTAHDLASYTARMQVKNKIGGTVLLALTTENGRIAIDATAKTITITISATDTAAITWTTGVYDLELVSPLGVVTELAKGAVTVEQEVTTS